MKTVLTTITPAVAKEMLKHNTLNRRIVDDRVRFYARSMKLGEWQLNPEGISFYENGNLRDGQHRLQAIILAGVPVQMNVTYDVPNDSFIVDRGANRTTANVLKLGGVNMPKIGAPINFMYNYAFNRRPSDVTILRFAEKYGALLETAVDISRAGKNHGIGDKAPIAAAVFCALTDGVDEKTLRRFANVLNSGFYDLDSETSAVVLRNTILKMGVCTGGQRNREQLFSFTTQAIRDFSRCVPRKQTYSFMPESPYWNHAKAYVMKEFE